MTDDGSAFAEQAFKLAEEALEAGEVPVGCVFVYEGQVIGAGRNRTNELKNATRHAEIEAIDEVLEWYRSKKLASDQAGDQAGVQASDSTGDQTGDHTGDLTGNLTGDLTANLTGNMTGNLTSDLNSLWPQIDLYVTVEPCVMCARMLRKLAPRAVYYGARNDRFGGCGSVLSIHDSPAIADAPLNVLNERLNGNRAIFLLQSFYCGRNPNAPVPRVKDKRRVKMDY